MPTTITWTRSDTVALAHNKCTACGGVGIKSRRQSPCNCVFRQIFRLCLQRFRSCVDKVGHGAGVGMEPQSKIMNNPRTYGRKNEEYLADFYLISKRNLTTPDQPTSLQWQIFKFHFLLGADWKMCCRRLNMDRGQFFHEVYRIQQALGRAYRETQPYGLFPLDEYFGGTIRNEYTAPTQPPPAADAKRLKVPLRFPNYEPMIEQDKAA